MTKPGVVSPLSFAISALLMASTSVSAQIEEVVVTAQKRSQDLQDVPIAVTAMNADMLKDAGISNVTGIAARTPGFSMGEFNPAQPQLYIRGIGSNGDGAASGEQSVAMFIDGVYVNRSAGTGLELFDIQSIEVLRGPQGTLWGKNAIAGAINVTTRKPSDQFEAAAEFTLGNLGVSNLRSMIAGPLTDKLNGKLSLNTKQRDPYVQSVVDSSIETGDVDSQGARAQLNYLASDNLEFLFTANYGTDERGGNASISDATVGITGQALTQAIAEGYPEADFYENYQSYRGYSDMENSGASLKVDWQQELYTLSSLTAYTSNKAKFAQAGMAVAPEIFYNYGSFSVSALGPFAGVSIVNPVDETSEMFSQELRLAGELNNVTWQAGAYYAEEDTDRTEGNVLDAPAFLIGTLGDPLLALAYSPSVDQARQQNTTTTYALFTEATYSVSDALDLTLGLRYTQETKDYSNSGSMRSLNDPSLPVLTSEYQAKETWDAPTYRLVANYRFNNDVMTYASVATGFKSGGFGISTPLSPALGEPFNEEQALNYELGFKSTLLDSKLRLNAALFRTEYKDLQILQQFLCEECTIAPLITKNAGEALSQGVELELTYLLTDHFTASANYSYLEAEFVDLEGTLANDEGNKLRNAPRNTYNAVLAYDTDLSFGGFLKARLEYIHKEKAYQDTVNNEYAAIPEYRLFNGRLAYTSANENWEVALFGNNLMNEEYYLHNFSLPPFGAVHVPGLPRNYGVTVTWKNF
ncbi:TonB-dependent receptor [Halioxenophilus sp. WMMB6]|uniref:TonB-dependent receptor n=1 Tax=Halioxenophilus sp. WMMB6 TaxID=3073815 RepID=UPI00295F343C|nr:TonB-dependent receptor [Halioxenophilus sp. WMMB6]